MEEKKPETAVPVEQKPIDSTIKKPKTLLLVIIVCVLLILVGVVTYFLLNQKKEKEPTKSKSVSVSVQEDVIQGSKYIATQKNANGSYWYQKYSNDVCPMKDGKMNCTFLPSNISFPSNTWAALGHYSTYKITLDDHYLELVKSDLDTLLSWCVHPENECTYLLSQPAIINEDLKDTKISEFLLKQGRKLAANKAEEHTMLAGIEVRQLAQLYQIFKEPIFMKEASERLEVLEKNLQKQAVNPATGEITLPMFTCWVSLAQVELGKAKNDKQMIINAIEYLKQSDRLDTINKLRNPVMIQPCIEAFFLAAKTTTYGYESDGKEALNIFLSNFYDSSSNKILFGENGTTYFSKSDILKGEPKSIFLADTAYTNYLKYLSVK